MRTRAFFYNALSAVILQVTTMIVGFIVPRLILKSYGSEINGLINSILQFISFFSLVEAGLAGAAIYSLYKPLAKQDIKEISSVLAASKKIYIRTGYIFLILVVIFAFIYPQLVTTPLLTKMEIGILIVVLGMTGAIDFFIMAKFRVLLTASQKLYIISISNIAQVLLNTILFVTLIYFSIDVLMLYSISSISVLLRLLILYSYVKYNYKYINYNEMPNYKALKKQWDVLFLQLLGSLRVGTPIIVATVFISLKSVSVYTIYNMVFYGVLGILSIFTNGLSSAFGDVIARGQQNVLQKAYQEFEYGYYMVIAWVYSCTLILIAPFISLYTAGINDIQYNYPILGFMFTINGLLQNLKTPQGMLVIAAGLYKETRVQSLIQALIGVVATVLFVQIWGIVGILIGMCLSELYRLVDLIFFIPRKLIKIKVLNSLYRVLRVFFVIILSYLPFQFIELRPANIWDWSVNAMFVSIYCFTVTVVINYLFERAIFHNLISRITNILKTGKEAHNV